MWNKKKMFRGFSGQEGRPSCGGTRQTVVFQISLCLCIMILLCGCSLAVSNAGMEGGDDRMIGVLITAEYLDIVTMETAEKSSADMAGDGDSRYHTGSAGNGQNLVLPYDPEDGGKLYADIDRSKGDNPSDWEISFGDLEGIQMFTPYWTMENGETCWGSVGTEGISDLDVRLSESDEGQERSISGTIYTLAGNVEEDQVYYANPVYQTADGRVYVTRGSGISASGEVSEGTELTSALDEETNMTECGKTKTEKCSVTIRYEAMYRPVRITVCQMDQGHEIVKKDVYRPEEMPEQIMAEKATEYILVEIEKEGLSGENVAAREVYGYEPEGDVWLESFSAREDGIVVKQETRVIWKT